MTQPNQTDTWLNSVSYGHSQSKATQDLYKSVWRRFSKFTNMTAEGIIEDYEKAEKYHISERTIKRKHSQKIQQWIIKLTNDELASGSIKTMVGVIMSFYKYNDLSLGHIPQARNKITYHNKDIENDELNKITALSSIREKAFYAIMAQSGLRPHTIKQLKIKHIEKILEPNNPLPTKITIPKEIAKGKFGEHPTFIADEAIKYTKQYLATRKHLTPESLLFTTKHGKQINTKNTSRTFRTILRKLKETGAINYQIRKGKPSELRLYNLRKYFRKYAYQMGFEHVNHLMGHTTKGSDSNYIPRDDEFYRELYRVKAMPFLRFEEQSQTEIHVIKTLKELKKQQQKEIETIKKQLNEATNRLNRIEKVVPPIEGYPETPEQLKYTLKQDKKYDKWRKEHPLPKLTKEQKEEFDKAQDEDSERYNDQWLIRSLQAQIHNLHKIIQIRDKNLTQIQNAVKPDKK